MNKENKRLDRLDALLNALPLDSMPMALSELDGYVTGLLACPETQENCPVTTSNYCRAELAR